MNVLPFVMAMLMLLTLLTYGRLQSFRSFQGFVYGYSAFVETEERDSYNRMIEHLYETTTMTKNSSDGEKASPIQASKKLNLALILDSSKDPQRKALFVQMFHSLVDQLYGEQPYFKELKEERPGYLSELMEVLGAMHQKVASLAELDNIKLTDPILDELLYRLLKTQSEGPTLRDEIAINNHEKIRVFLASSHLLEAIYGEKQVVESIITKRKELYREVARKEGLSTKEASEQFASFLNQFPSAIDPYLNKEVSKTAPVN